MKKEDSVFKQIAPGVLVNTTRIKVSIVHPDPCWIIRDDTDTMYIAFPAEELELAVFSSREQAEHYIAQTKLSNAVVKEMTWQELVETFGKSFHSCLFDHRGETGFYVTAPLVLDI